MMVHNFYLCWTGTAFMGTTRYNPAYLDLKKLVRKGIPVIPAEGDISRLGEQTRLHVLYPDSKVPPDCIRE